MVQYELKNSSLQDIIVKLSTNGTCKRELRGQKCVAWISSTLEGGLLNNLGSRSWNPVLRGSGKLGSTMAWSIILFLGSFSVPTCTHLHNLLTSYYNCGKRNICMNSRCNDETGLYWCTFYAIFISLLNFLRIMGKKKWTSQIGFPPITPTLGEQLVEGGKSLLLIALRWKYEKYK